MTDLHIALAEAGVKLPSQIQRIWVWLKDHQSQAAKSVAVALHIPDAGSLLCHMEKRKMVSSVEVLNRSTQRWGKVYTALGREFELLPMPKKAKPFFTTQVPAVTTDQSLAVMTDPVQVEAIKQFNQALCKPATFDLDSMTIAEARALYFKLAKMFKGEAA